MGSLADDAYLAERRLGSDSLTKRFSEKHPLNEIIRAEEHGIYKLSKIILEYGSDFLEEAHTYEHKYKVVTVCIGAWNLSWMDESVREQALKDLLETMTISPDSSQGKDLTRIIEELIIRRQTEYPFFNRIIRDFSLSETQDDAVLNVISNPLSILAEKGKQYLSERLDV